MLKLSQFILTFRDFRPLSSKPWTIFDLCYGNGMMSFHHPRPRLRPRTHHPRPRLRPDHSRPRPPLPRQRPLKPETKTETETETQYISTRKTYIYFTGNIFLHEKHHFFTGDIGIYRRPSAFFMPLFYLFFLFRSCGLDRVVSSETETIEPRDRDETETFERRDP